MVAAPRQSKQAIKIAAKILGQPLSMQAKKSAKRKKIDIELTHQDTTRVR